MCVFITVKNKPVNMEEKSSYRLGKVAWFVVLASGLLAFFGALSTGGLAYAITNFASGSIFMLILLSVCKFIFVFSKKTLLGNTPESS